MNVAICWLYCAGLESSGAQGTLGQQVLGIRVCDDRLRRISFARATARFLAQWLSVLTCGLGGMGGAQPLALYPHISRSFCLISD